MVVIQNTKQDRLPNNGDLNQSPPVPPTIAFLTAAMEDHFGLAMWTAIVEAAHEQNANVVTIANDLLEDSFSDTKSIDSIFRAANEDVIDAIIIYGARLGTSIPQKTFHEFCHQFTSKPVVIIGQQVDGIPSVLSDNYDGMHDLVRHLTLDHGYRRIAFIRGPEGQIGAETRLQAYKDALSESNIKFDPNLISPPGSWEASTGENAVNLFIDERNVDFDAIVGVNDAIALDAMWALRNHGLEVPDDVAVVGYDGQIIAKAATPPLTTVRQHLKEQCTHAVNIVFTKLQGGDAPDLIEIPTKLCIRQSCGCSSSAIGRAVTKTIVDSVKTDTLNVNHEDRIKTIAAIVDSTIEGSKPTWSKRLFESFIADVENHNPDKFLQEFAQCIEKTASIETDINDWQRVVSLLGHFSHMQFSGETKTERIEELIHQSRVLIGEKIQQIETRQSMIFDRQYANMRETTRSLSSACELDDFLEMLYQSLPRFGIRSCYLSLYESAYQIHEDDLQVEPSSLNMILAFDESGRLASETDTVTPSATILPHQEILARNKINSIVVKSLDSADGPLGVVLFEVYPPNGRACDMLQEQISSSLNYALLLQARQQEHDLLQQAYTEVEEQVKEKEIELEFEIVDREHAQQALTREQYLLRLLMEQTTDVIYFKDQESRFIKVNTSCAKIHSKESPDDMLGLTAFDLYTQEHAQEAHEDEMRVLTTGEPIIGKEEKETWADGHETWASTTKLPIRDEKGNIIGTFGISRDITESKRAEQELRRHAAHLEAINTIISLTSTAVDFQELLKITLDLSLYALGLNMGIVWIPPHMTFRELLPPEYESPHYYYDLARNDLSEIHTINDWQEIAEEDPHYSFYEAILKPHGVRASITVPIKAEGGNRIGGICIASPEAFNWTTEETTLLEAVGRQVGIAAERLRLIDQIQEQMKQVQQITDTVPDGVLLLDSKNRVILANPAGTRDLYLLAKSSVGNEISHLGGYPISEILREEVDIPWHEINASNRIFEIVAQPINTPNTTKNWVVVIRDVTQERETQRQVQQQERLAAVGQLAGGIAHDFNNLLTTIMLYAQMPLRKQQLPEDLKKPLETILGESRKAADLVQQILDFSRHAPIERHPIDLGPFIKEAVKVLQRTIPENISLFIEIDPDEYIVEADPTRIQQVLMNLVVNARDAMPEGGVLRVGITSTIIHEKDEDANIPTPGMTPGKWFCLSVKDTGTGIPEDIMPHIFEPFFTTKAAGKGTGLGLSQVWGIVKQHEGYVHVESSIGEGTEFLVYLPIHQAAEGVDLRPSLDDSIPRGSGERILLVEDSQHVREVSEELLSDLGYQVVSARNGREALEIFKLNGNFDLIFTDVVMPEVGGVALLHTLRDMGSEIKTIAVTGHMLAEDLQELRKDGVSGIIFKPLEIEEVAEEVRRVLDGK